MTAKDYRVIAEAVRSVLDTPSGVELRPGVIAVANSLADHLRSINQRFDVARFLAACGVPDNQ